MLTVDDRLRAAAAEVQAHVEASLVPLLPPATNRVERRVPALRRGVGVLVAAAVVVLLAVGGVLLLLRASTEEPPVVTTLPPTTTTTAVPETTAAPTTTTMVETTTTAVPPQAAPITWTRVRSDLFDDVEITDVVAGGPGVVAIGRKSDNWADPNTPSTHFIALVSSDGETWEQTADIVVDPDIWWLRDLAAGPAGFVAVGHSDTDAAVFHSSDGLAWQQVLDVDLSSAPVQGIDGVTAWGDGFIAAGGVNDDAAVWTSADGLEWTRITSDAFVADEGQAFGLSVVASRSSLIMSGHSGFLDGESAGVLWHSTDGVAWEGIEFPQELHIFESVQSDPETGRVLAFGWNGIWASDNGLDWDRISDCRWSTQDCPPPASGVAWFGDNLVAGGVDMALSLWLSTDSGVTWIPIDHSGPEFDGYAPQALDVVAFGDRVIAVGEGSDSYLGVEGAVWIGEFTG